MPKTDISFYIARQAGLEFVFNSGRAVAYPMHTHVSVYTVTLVRRGTALVLNSGGQRAHTAGEVYVDAPHEPHRPAYSEGHDLVSLCVRKKLFGGMNQPGLEALCLEHARGVVDRRLLTPEELTALMRGIAEVYCGLPQHRRQGRTPEFRHSLPSATHDSLPGAPSLPEGQPAASGRGHVWRRLRRFKRAMGIPPHQYEVQSRVRAAKKMLSTPMSIAEAAALAGFYDQSHLNRWFNRCIGLTPRVYREACVYLDTW